MFGFGIGDIILVSQLTYKLYGAVTSGRLKADHDVRELQNALFGLRCALDHLARVRGIVAAEDTQAVNTSDDLDSGIYARLEKIIRSCREALEDLDAAATEKFRAGVGIPANAADGESSPTTSSPQKRYKEIADSFRAHLVKIRWDLTKQDLKEYRDRLQAHTDAINIVLNTFLWSDTHNIGKNGTALTEQMTQLKSEMLASNAQLLDLVEEIHRLHVQPKPSPPRQLPHQMISTGSSDNAPGFGQGTLFREQ